MKKERCALETGETIAPGGNLAGNAAQLPRDSPPRGHGKEEEKKEKEKNKPTNATGISRHTDKNGR